MTVKQMVAGIAMLVVGSLSSPGEGRSDEG